MSGQIHAPAALPLGEEPLLDRSLGGPQNRSERHGKEKNPAIAGTRTPTPRPSSPDPVSIPTALSRLTQVALFRMRDLRFSKRCKM
jgi:hypothetical protein